jgi:hypothetical protein
VLKRWREWRLEYLEADLSDWRSALVVRETWGGHARAALRARREIARLEKRITRLRLKASEKGSDRG